MKFNFAILGLAFCSENEQSCKGKDTKLRNWPSYTLLYFIEQEQS